MKKIILSGMTAIVLATSIYADSIRESIQEVMPQTKFEKYEKANELYGFYRIYMENGQMFYINPLDKSIVFGEVWNNKGQSITQHFAQTWQKELEEKQLKNVTVEKLTKNSLKVNFGKGSSQYDFVIFTDPECPYCKTAEDAFKNKDVTIYVNFMPLDFHKNAEKWSLNVLSSKEPLKTLNEIKSGKEVKVAHSNTAKEQLAKMVALAKELNITGTPKLFVIDKTDNKVIDVINGANVPQIQKYL